MARKNIAEEVLTEEVLTEEVLTETAFVELGGKYLSTSVFREVAGRDPKSDDLTFWLFDGSLQSGKPIKHAVCVYGTFAEACAYCERFVIAHAWSTVKLARAYVPDNDGENTLRVLGGRYYSGGLIVKPIAMRGTCEDVRAYSRKLNRGFDAGKLNHQPIDYTNIV